MEYTFAQNRLLMLLEEIMYRILADLLTASRLVFSSLMIWLGITRGADAFPDITWLLLAGWTTDSIDGYLARRDKSGRQTWLGCNEVTVDAIFLVSSFLYLALAGFVPWAICLIYLSVEGMLVAVFRARSLLIAMGAPLALLPPIIAIAQRSSLAWAYVGWGVLALAADGRGFFRRVRLFWDGLRDISVRGMWVIGE